MILFLCKGNVRESQRELQRWFSRQQQDPLANQQIPEDVENEREDNAMSYDRTNGDHYSHNYPSDGVPTALEDVQIRMLQQNDAVDRNDTQNNQKSVPSLATSNTGDQDDGR